MEQRTRMAWSIAIALFATFLAAISYEFCADSNSIGRETTAPCSSICRNLAGNSEISEHEVGSLGHDNTIRVILEWKHAVPVNSWSFIFGTHDPLAPVSYNHMDWGLIYKASEVLEKSVEQVEFSLSRVEISENSSLMLAVYAAFTDPRPRQEIIFAKIVSTAGIENENILTFAIDMSEKLGERVVQGEVLDEAGQGVTGVLVVFRWYFTFPVRLIRVGESCSFALAAITDEQGAFRFSGVASSVAGVIEPRRVRSGEQFTSSVSRRVSPGDSPVFVTFTKTRASRESTE